MRIIWLIFVFLIVSCQTAPVVQPTTPTVQPITPVFVPTVTQEAAASKVKNFAKVDEGIYRSGRPEPTQYKMLAEVFKIKNVINLESYWLETKTLAEEKAAVLAAGMAYHHIPMAPIGEFDDKKVMQAYQLLHTLERPILVHCFRGSERTGVAVATYRILENGWGYKEAFAEMDKYGFSPLFKGWKHDLREMIEK
jgi:protein tyrosine/serine phosphatase